MKPTPSLYSRVRFTTKDVGKGFYRGNRTGSMGAHTPKGGYLIDYRKVRNYAVPDLKEFKLTPFVTRMINDKEAPDEDASGLRFDEDEPFEDVFRAADLKLARRTRALRFLTQWKQQNITELNSWLESQRDELDASIQYYKEGGQVDAIERLVTAQKKQQGSFEKS